MSEHSSNLRPWAEFPGSLTRLTEIATLALSAASNPRSLARFGVRDRGRERCFPTCSGYIDQGISRVLDALESAKVAENTFVFLMSDNGAFRLGREGLDVGSNAPLRHGGVTCWEGGLRVIAMARWPGRIPAGSVASQPMWSPDLVAASAKLAGAELPSGVVFDGKNPLPILTDRAASPHESFYFVYRNHAALRKGD